MMIITDPIQCTGMLIKLITIMHILLKHYKIITIDMALCFQEYTNMVQGIIFRQTYSTEINNYLINMILYTMSMHTVYSSFLL